MFINSFDNGLFFTDVGIYFFILAMLLLGIDLILEVLVELDDIT